MGLSAFAQRKKKKGKDEEPPTQQLEVLPDPPTAVVGDIVRLGFLVSPPSAKGLLTQQTRDAIRAIQKGARGAQIAKIRAFVSGTGDLRRIQTIVSEEFSEKKQTVPALTVVQVGMLPMEGAQVLLEATTQEKRSVNPAGVAFFSGQQVPLEGKVENPLQPVVAEFAKSLANLKLAADGSGVAASSMLRVTCLVSSLAEHSTLAQALAKEFPSAVTAIVQLQRGPVRPVVECEGVGRLSKPPASPVVLQNPQGLPSSPNYSQVALAGPARVVLSGMQVAYGAQDSDVRLAFDRLRRALEAAQTTTAKVYFSNFYPLTNSAVEKIRAQRFSYFDRTRPPASTLILFEGLPSLEASFAVDVVASLP